MRGDPIEFLNKNEAFDSGRCACKFCSWEGRWKDACREEHGDWESGYYTVRVCPNGCEQEHGDVSLYEVPDDD